MSALVGFGTVNWLVIGSQNLGLLRYLRSGVGDLGRVARQGSAIGSGGIGGEGSDGGESGARGGKYASAVAKLGAFRLEVEDNLSDRAA